MRVLRAFLAAVAVLAAGAAMAPGAWATGLAVTVSGAPENLIVGDSVTLTARVTNLSSVPATDTWTHFTPYGDDPFEDPPKLTPVLAGFCTNFGPGDPSQHCQLTVPSLAAAGEPGDSSEVKVAVAATQPGALRVDVGADADPGLSAPQLSWTGTVEPKADISLNFSANVETIANGGSVTFRALVTNTSAAGMAYGTAVTFTLPPEVEIVSQPDGCTGTKLNLTCPVGDLGPQLTAQRLLTLRSTQEGQFTVLASAKWARPNVTDTKTQTSVTVLPPPDTSGSGTPEPTPTPTPTPVSTKTRAASFATLVSGAPGTNRCLRTRKLSVVLRSIKNVDPVRATIRVTGRKHALVLKGSKAQRPFSLKLPRSGRATVTVTVTLESGRRYTSKRTYRLC